MKKSLSLFLTLMIIMMGLLTGCGGSNTSGTAKGDTSGNGGSNETTDSGKKIELNFWSFWGSQERRPVIQHMVDEFNKSQDKIHVKYTYLPWGDVWTKELAAVAAGNPPDAIINDINSVGLRAKKNQVTDLTPYIQNDPSISKRYYPQLWDLMKYQGKVYGLPYNTDTRILFYNKDLFKKAGLDPEKAPQTWQELWDDAKKIDQKQGDNYKVMGFYPLYSVGADFWMQNADGASYFNKDMKPVINDPTNVETINWYKKWIDKYGWHTINNYQALFKTKSANPFYTGKLGMLVMTPTTYTEIRDYAKDLNFGVSLIPEMKPGSGHTSWGGGFDIEIPKGSKHPKAAYEFLKYMTGKKAQQYWATKTFDNVANIAAAEATAKSPDLTKEEQLVYSMATEGVKHNVMTPLPLKAPDFNNKVGPLVDKAIHGQMAPKDALDKAQSMVEKEINGGK